LIPVNPIPQPERYLVGYARGATKEAAPAPQLAETLHADPEIDVVESRGPADRPSLFVVTMTTDRAEQLKHELGQGVVVEKDAPLSF
jgi:hypothetical protein